ncbi:hypothetical protein WOLCODRAFT_81482 [Wolfiporia cocos MD-104 SS10]|uniref:Uncharacterized protein n=1 Tax=Wolfiporia cocos (strain MD-104) TaxID=742152 RepID=A0A2H3JHD4_WOLCO|nr:hypothetical protein WOLCODRAFT_81482 [Wolfiporia cocos MD-104 SS10]
MPPAAPPKDSRLYAPTENPRLPPVFSRYHEHELQLPQHNLSTPHPEGLNGRYLWIAPDEARESGWGTFMQEVLLNSYLAYRSHRSFVFDNYTWNEDGWLDYVLYTGRPSSAQIPLSAVIRGPIVGEPFANESAQSPRAVNREFWHKVCPNPRIINRKDVLAAVGSRPTAQTLIDKWVELLDSADDPCVEVPRLPTTIFDAQLFGDGQRLLDAWPSFSKSPMLTELGWSPLVELAFDTNREIISPSRALEPYLSSQPFAPGGARYAPLPGLLVLHVRRGTFQSYCTRLATAGAGFHGYNAFAALPDRLDAGLALHSTAERRVRAYRPHCFPSVREIVRRVEEVRRSDAGRGLRDIYVMTNAQTPWVTELKAALRQAGGWENVASSRDLLVNREQKYVKQALDVLIGQRAQVFVGNGFSTLSGQVVMLRMANGVPPETNRFW